MKKLKEKIKEWLIYALPFLLCVAMFIHWLVFGYSTEGKVIALFYMGIGYFIHWMKEKRDFEE